MSASPGGTASVAASTVGTLDSASGLKRSTSRQMFFTAFGLRQPLGDSTTSEPPLDRVSSTCVSEPPT